MSDGPRDPSRLIYNSSRLIYKLPAGDVDFVIYNAEVLGNPADHQPGKWYIRAYPEPIGKEPSEPFDTAEAAERAAKAMASLIAGTP